MPGTTDRRATIVVAGADRWSAQDLAERIERFRRCLRGAERRYTW
ncbi:hypothetical protein [Streptomyces nogalater]|uniref:Uncharacterized protein n=1 Tax=Streptomyces nogalater TaxID=38314 RepID=A0ABW0WCG9_STRNO